MAIFEGAGVALITPFNADGSVNYSELERVIDFQIEEGTDSIIICGTTGEASTMSHDEQLDVVKACVDHVAGRVPVIAGAGSNCTREAEYLARKSSDIGVDGLLVVTPYYNKATQGGLVKYYTEIAKCSDTPIIMYNVPGRTGCNIAPATAAKLVKEVDTIVGIKEASGNISQVADIMNLTQGDIDLYSGNDDQIVPILSLGGKGVISVLSNVVPKDTHEIVASYLRGDVKTSRELQLKYIDLCHALFCEVNPIPVKRAMAEMGYCCGAVRGPLTEMEEPNAQKMIAIMKELNIL
ncbi:MAG: 4-hydroxy-tetrahydrodipicolinate synthase [Lachnospiraceae bacterium]|nr:4-hydroxy-tetrahydrodipicolinate synthase [Lachnospiraceae bacterium]